MKAKEAEFRKKAPALTTVKQSTVLGKRKRRSKEEENLKGQAERNVNAVLSCIIYLYVDTRYKNISKMLCW